MKTDLNAFIVETFKRLKQQSPTFFKWWGRVNTALLFIGGIPTTLLYIQTNYGIDFSAILPHAAWVKYLLALVAVCGGWGKFMTKLTVMGNPSADPTTTLPFTAKKQSQS